MSRFEITSQEYEEIKKQEKRIKDKRISQNLRILMLRYEGKKVKDIAEQMRITENTVSRICMRYKQQGLQEFMRQKYTSHCRLLSEKQETEILEKFREAAEQGQEVTAKDIKAAFDEACGKDTGNAYIYLVLRRHNWRKVVPRPKHPKSANQEAIEASKKLNKILWKPL